MNLKKEIISTKVENKEIAIFWLGQAGFLIKDSKNTHILIDPYLTDCGERMKGFKRLSPKLISPDELESDIYISTHIHFDHFDYDAIPIVAECTQTNFYGPKSSVEEFKKIGINKDRIKLLELGKKIEEKNIKIKAVYADHGSLAPDAIGLLLNIDGIKLYFTGDTAYRPEKLNEVVEFNPDIAVLSINGKFGNLTADEGAKVVEKVKPKIAIPSHFWTFKEHNGNPQLFEDKVIEYCPKTKVEFMAQGQSLKYRK